MNTLASASMYMVELPIVRTCKSPPVVNKLRFGAVRMRSEPKNLAGTRNDVIKTTRTHHMLSIIHINSARLSSEMPPYPQNLKFPPRPIFRFFCGPLASLAISLSHCHEFRSFSISAFLQIQKLGFNGKFQ